MDEEFIKSLFRNLKDKKNADPRMSYTSKLINNSDLLAKKIGEESSELIVDFIQKNKKGIINESADLVYHLLVLWVSADIEPQAIWDELTKRKSQSGILEKKSRRKVNE